MVAHAENDEGEDEDEHLVVKRHLCSFRWFVSATLLDYVPQPNP